MSLLQDLRYAARSLRKNTGFATAAILTLALGVGASTTIFSVVHAVMLRPLPYTGAERLVRVWESNPELGRLTYANSQPNFLDWHARCEGIQRACRHLRDDDLHRDIRRGRGDCQR